MKITDEWRMYDPKDPRTHPEGISRVEIEFENGRVLKGQYSRDTGWLATVGAWPPQNTNVKRWRYTSEIPDD